MHIIKETQLHLDYEIINLSEKYLAFKLKTSVLHFENNQEGITDWQSWKEFENNPHSHYLKDKIIEKPLLLNKEVFHTSLSIEQMIKKSVFAKTGFHFDIFKHKDNNQELYLLDMDASYCKETNEHTIWFNIKDINDSVIYYENEFQLPIFSNTLNEVNLLKQIKNSQFDFLYSKTKEEVSIFDINDYIQEVRKSLQNNDNDFPLPVQPNLKLEKTLLRMPFKEIELSKLQLADQLVKNELKPNGKNVYDNLNIGVIRTLLLCQLMEITSINLEYLPYQEEYKIAQNIYFKYNLSDKHTIKNKIKI